MNVFIDTQLLNMISMTKAAVQSCRLAALRDDGKVSPEEEALLKKIGAASDAYVKALQKIRAAESRK